MTEIIKAENTTLAIRLLSNADDVVGLLAMCAAGRDVPIHVRDEAVRLLERLFVEREAPTAPEGGTG